MMKVQALYTQLLAVRACFDRGKPNFYLLREVCRFVDFNGTWTAL